MLCWHYCSVLQPRWSSSVHDLRLLFYASYPALPSYRSVRAEADSSTFLCVGGGTCSGALALLYLLVPDWEHYVLSVKRNTLSVPDGCLYTRDAFGLSRITVYAMMTHCCCGPVNYAAVNGLRIFVSVRCYKRVNSPYEPTDCSYS